MSIIDRVLSDFIDAWNAGRRPKVREYLARVPEGSDRDDLAEQLSSWLDVAPTPVHDDAIRAQIREEPAVRHVLDAVGGDAGLWPTVLPELRERAGLSIADVARRVRERFALGDERRTVDYLRRLEQGEFDATRVSRRLLDALGSILGISGASLRDAGTFGSGLRPAAAARGALFRSEGDVDALVARDLELLTAAALTPAPAPMDELDRLFTGGPDG